MMVANRAWLGFFALSFAYAAVSIGAEATRSISIHVRETAGIRRFGYPVSAQVSIPAAALRDHRHARLTAGDKPLAAQLTTVSKHADGSIDRLAIDFNLSPGPFEEVRLALEYGDQIAAVEPKQGLKFSETDEGYQVSAYTIRKDARPLITSVRYGREYLKEAGLNVRVRSEKEEHSLDTASRKWTVVKQGPFHVLLRCEGNYPARNGIPELPYALELEFVSSKSWVGLRHVVKPANPSPQLSLVVDGSFQLEPRLLWDTDVDYWLYGVVEKSEQMTFTQQATSWECLLGKVGQETKYAASSPEKTQSKGWGHFQEARQDGNVVAFGFSGSCARAAYTYTLSSDGRMLFEGKNGDGSELQLNSYFHFIPVPAQHTARTSPAAMMTPLEVRYPAN